MTKAPSVRWGPTVAAVILVAQLAGLLLVQIRKETLDLVLAGFGVGLIAGMLLFLVRRQPRIAALVGGGLALLTAGALVQMAGFPPHPVIFLILGPSIAGGVIALVNPESRTALGVALLLVMTSAYLILIAGAGLLYVPALVALVYGMWAPGAARAHQAEGSVRAVH